MKLNTVSYAACLLLLLALLFPLSDLRSEEAEQLTRLRASTPKGSFATSNRGAAWLRYVEVDVKNVGGAAANGVRVIATLPDGERVPLEGPSSISKNQSALYAREIRALVGAKNDIKAEATCDNCRK